MPAVHAWKGGLFASDVCARRHPAPSCTAMTLAPPHLPVQRQRRLPRQTGEAGGGGRGAGAATLRVGARQQGGGREEASRRRQAAAYRRRQRQRRRRRQLSVPSALTCAALALSSKLMPHFRLASAHNWAPAGSPILAPRRSPRPSCQSVAGDQGAGSQLWAPAVALTGRATPPAALAGQSTATGRLHHTDQCQTRRGSTRKSPISILHAGGGAAAAQRAGAACGRRHSLCITRHCPPAGRPAVVVFTSSTQNAGALADKTPDHQALGESAIMQWNKTNLNWKGKRMGRIGGSGKHDGAWKG